MLKVKKNASSRTNETYPVFVNSKEAAKEKSIQVLMRLPLNGWVIDRFICL